jgi:hypothetical protein
MSSDLVTQRGFSALTTALFLAARSPEKVTSQRCTRTPRELLLHCEIHPLDAGHYGWEDKAEAYGSRVVDWVGGGYKRVAR